MPCDLSIENSFYRQGCRSIAGVDEAGRGPLAGPVCAAAVILPRDFTHAELNDSKKLSPKKRASIYREITTDSRIQWALVVLDACTIDRLNILRATHRAMAEAVRKLPSIPDRVLIDGLPVPQFPFPQEAVVKGDGRSLSIAAASVIAKVERDRLMETYAKEFPQYGFESHKGYGTKKHLEMLKKHGPCSIHRKTFQPVAQLAFDFKK